MKQPIIEISSKFKSKTRQVIVAIVLFVIFYLLLIAASVGILIASIYGGLFVMQFGHIYTFIIGVSIMGIGIMLFIFMIKFVFARFKNENPYHIHVTEQEHPQLFALIREVANAANTRFPKKVFLVPEVNAAVSYNSSFWSMFLPVRKNLEIGLGLLNSVNTGELKAVLAHEFGHFSQKSMSIGSYVYTTNKIIYNLVYDYDQWDNMLDQWRVEGGILGFFGSLTHLIVSMVRSLLRGAYSMINIQYLSLSREMEFHADLIAASIAGSQNIISALRRIEFTNIAYNQTVDFLNTIADKKLYSTNIYPIHSELIQRQSKQFNLPIEENLPIISNQALEQHTHKSRINYKDQWASHPSMQEREDNLQKSPPTNYKDTTSAWSLLSDIESLQTKQSRLLYNLSDQELASYDKVSCTHFLELLEEEQDKYKISAQYKEYYNHRYLTKPSTEEITNVTLTIPDSSAKFTDLFNETITKQAEIFSQNQSDLEILYSIRNKEIKAKYFEFDNQKYRRRKVDVIIAKLAQEIKDQEKSLEGHDKQIVQFFYSCFAHKDNALAQQYLKQIEELFVIQEGIHEFSHFFLKVQKVYQELVKIIDWNDEVGLLIRSLNELETNIKKYLKSDQGIILRDMLQHEQIKEKVNHYIDEHIFYTSLTSFDGDKFSEFVNFIQSLHLETSTIYGQGLKKLTDFQLKALED